MLLLSDMEPSSLSIPASVTVPFIASLGFAIVYLHFSNCGVIVTSYSGCINVYLLSLNASLVEVTVLSPPFSLTDTPVVFHPTSGLVVTVIVSLVF